MRELVLNGLAAGAFACIRHADDPGGELALNFLAKRRCRFGYGGRQRCQRKQKAGDEYRRKKIGHVRPPWSIGQRASHSRR